MEFALPSEVGYTIYSKSGCKFCTKLKNIFKSNQIPFTLIDCDDYLVEDRDNFILFMKQYMKKSIVSFPILFNNKTCIGNYNKALQHLHICYNIDITSNTDQTTLNFDDDSF
jgi:glutaredoxin